MFSLFYEKNKNNELFKSSKEIVNIESIQNYIPLYKKFFALNKDNYNSFNLNETRHIKKILKKDTENSYKIKLSTKNNVDSFFKFSPLMDPLKLMIGKYDSKDIIQLPKYDETDIPKGLEKIYDTNNAAYTDGFFYYLSSQLLNNHNFFHGIDFYGSFLCIKNDYKINIYDDAEYLYESTFFNNHKNSLFNIESTHEERLLKYETRSNKKKINFLKTLDNKNLSLKSVQDFGEMFEIVEPMDSSSNVVDASSNGGNSGNGEIGEDFSIVFEYLNNCKSCKNTGSVSSSESSDCSSRSSNSDILETLQRGEEFDSSEEESEGEGEGEGEGENESGDESEWETDEENSACSSLSMMSEDEVLEATLEKFPVQMICLEKLDNTLDNYISYAEEISNDEWKSIFFQIIATLLVYQKVFDFTHNDLHTNNVMYEETDKKHLYYKFNNRHYKVPTYGKLYKIIDFGRSIYRFKGALCMSDSYHPKGDAATQYNIPPYFNENKPRLEPNKSFDLCRLGCSLFDYFFDDVNDGYTTKDEISKMVNEWCLDYKERNILYKKNGEERYEDFKLYKMIARTVKNKEPEKFIEREIFECFKVSSKNIDKKKKIMNIDALPDLTV